MIVTNPETGEPSPGRHPAWTHADAKLVRPVYYELVGMGLEETIDNEKVYGRMEPEHSLPIGTVDPDG